MLRGKYRVPFYMSTDCENILRRFLVLNPAKRCTLEVRGPGLGPALLQAPCGSLPGLGGSFLPRGPSGAEGAQLALPVPHASFPDTHQKPGL